METADRGPAESASDRPAGRSKATRRRDREVEAQVTTPPETREAGKEER